MTGGIVLGIGLCFHDHAPKQAAVVLAFHQPATHQIRTYYLGGATKEVLRQGWEVLADGLSG